ncbi:polyprenyl diphosphate synthase [Kiritimatiella glycovorans]|uniref:Isoprenyl transferase n=1 Tax=Kiritimatiella glycovorans TaxID=1307763 RepID=A0A0G3EJG8_9BACT|nr:polyprenyl diphosphate synthase [Kiritimatiella glycovorans]AKJ65587.1 Isoprenyl transferase [Kiritimatiella glycovorans]
MNTEQKTPRHVAIIMDGNGRWAAERNLSRLKGHEEGAQSIPAVLRVCEQRGVDYLTLFAFSTENWNRPRDEVEGLMQLLARFLRERKEELHKQEIRLRAMGDTGGLLEPARSELERVMEATSGYGRGHLILALNYGGRAEIARASLRIAEEVAAAKLNTSQIDETEFARHLDLPDVPDPDLLIRTSGELRLSNFMLWQLSYAEIYVTDTLWPDFREKEFSDALEAYGRRERRYGRREKTA